MKQRLIIIIFFILLFIGAVVIVGSALYNPEAKEPPPGLIEQEMRLPAESGAFRRSDFALNYLNMPESQRSLATYHDNRAYPGAPPSIPHPLLSAQGIGGKNCLQCHQNGGYTPQFQAYAPVTPHPEWLSCLSCHVPVLSKQRFVETNWEKPAPPRLGARALVEAPLVMPHGLQGRENCLACHAGPAAPKEIRVTHPERVNCRQCHVAPVTEELFPPPVDSGREGEQFKRRPGGLSNDSLDEATLQQLSEWIKQ
jgi:cytochrome c-type protein NapB